MIRRTIAAPGRLMNKAMVAALFYDSVQRPSGFGV